LVIRLLNGQKGPLRR